METLITRFFSELGPLKIGCLNGVVEQLEDVEDMFKFLWDLEEAHQCLIPPTICRKSDPDAEKVRTEGNILYKMGNFKAALQVYDTSILLAPHPELEVYGNPEENCNADAEDSMQGIRCEPRCSDRHLRKYKTLALGYANRSAVFIELKKYDQCLADIDMALKYGYPKELISKLEDRRERCLRAKERSGHVSAEKDSVSNNEKTPPKLANPNPSVPAFSSAIKVAYSSDKGRHVVATRDILPGELIVVEKSNCSIAYYKPDEEAHCPVCLLQCQRKIPCPSCCLAIFCSDSCRARGLEEHMKECKIFTAMHAIDLEEDFIACLAVKLVVNTTYAELKDKLPLLKKESKLLPPDKIGFNEKGMFVSSDYRSVYHMASPKTKRRNTGIMKSCLVAFLITKMLNQSEVFFVTRDGLPLKPNREDFILTGTALLRQMALQTGIMCISDIKVNNCDSSTEKEVVGNGIYPALHLISHSCNPPTLFYNFGHVKIVRTVLPISKDQEVTLGLFDRYQSAPFFLRKMKMAVLGIECTCDACVGLWPSLPDIPTEIHFKCIKCSNPVTGPMGNLSCVTCNMNYRMPASNGKKKKNTPVKKWWSVVDQVIQGEKKFSHIRGKLLTGQKVTKNDYEFVCSFSCLLGKHVQEPSMIFSLLRDVLLMFFYKEM